MYEFLICLQVVSIMVMFAVAIVVVMHWSSKAHAYFFICCVSIIVNNIGYLYEMLGSTSDEALIGTVVAYIGKPFIGLSMLFFVTEFCEKRIRRRYKVALSISSVVIWILVATSDMNHLYYTSREYVYEGVFPHNVYGHGPMYYVYMSSLFVYLLIVIILTFKRLKKAKTTKERKQLISILAMSCVVFSGLIMFFTGKTGGYDTTSVAYVVCAVIFALSMIRYNIFEDLDTVTKYYMDGLEQGIVAVTDKTGEIFFSNKNAQTVMPSLAEGVHFISEYEIDIQNKSLYRTNGKVYETTPKKIVRDNNKQTGTMILFQDVTDTIIENESLKNEVVRKSDDIVRMQKSLIIGLADVVEARDECTGTHVKKTQDYVRIIVDALQKEPEYRKQVSDDYARMVVDAAPLHDIGKISVPDSILLKKGRLEPDEFDVVKQHTTNGAKFIDNTLSNVESEEYLKIAHDIALYHHEKWNGKGYPEGLAGEQIPLSARIMAVADVYDALVSQRCYKDAFSHEKAKDIMFADRGIHFDGHLVDVFFENLEKQNQK